MPNNKKKTIKSIKGRDSAHPYSRKAQQLRRALHRQDKLEKSKTVKDSEHIRLVEKFLHFKYALEEEKIVATLQDMHEMMMLYLERFDEEFEKLKSELRKGRPRPPRMVLLESIKEKEMKEYRDGGIDVPDLTQAANVHVLRQWDGDYNGIKVIKTLSIRHPDAVQEQEQLKRLQQWEKQKGSHMDISDLQDGSAFIKSKFGPSSRSKVLNSFSVLDRMQE